MHLVLLHVCTLLTVQLPSLLNPARGPALQARSCCNDCAVRVGSQQLQAAGMHRWTCYALSQPSV